MSTNPNQVQSNSFFRDLLGNVINHFTKNNMTSQLTVLTVSATLACVAFNNHFELIFKSKVAFWLRFTIIPNNPTLRDLVTTRRASHLSSVLLTLVRVVLGAVCHVIIRTMYHNSIKVSEKTSDNWVNVSTAMTLEFILERFFMMFMTPTLTILNPTNMLFGLVQHTKHQDNVNIFKVVGCATTSFGVIWKIYNVVVDR
jgi:hypothetical protein